MSLTNYKLYNKDFLEHSSLIEDNSIDLIIADPPYCLGKDYGNESDKQEPEKFLLWTEEWVRKILPKLKDNGSMYIFTSWRYAPEIFVFMKKHLHMLNEIIWDRKVPSMGGSTRRFSSVHDTIGFFAKTNKYYFNLDAVRIPYDAPTKKARTRSIFVGKKWLELGCNPKDIWSVARLHRIHKEREEHPTQKPLELIARMIKASCPENGVILDPFAGSGTTLDASLANARKCIAFEINSDYCNVIRKRLQRYQDNIT